MKLHDLIEQLDVKNANFARSSFRNANLAGASFAAVNLAGAQFIDVDLAGIDVEELLRCYQAQKQA
ncbi:hypothetical protein BTR14_03380 [Rhizobium rhizosphaerae]|uniref:Pentapeptide repeat-containing protein n=1 Tax=Xaviernesmea rhizosphaerae TaxID=1672749 RepID=A0ABX3PHI8_9HYPH|nr:pentapeptide repeat-containing protein [Xaviernesmea rhizosphaerae]OQP87621.1 hypothetical protein BTR14_03380 [Xaviernesmea rhizosphaerae]